MKMALERRGGLCTLAPSQGLTTAIAMANAVLDRKTRAEELTQSLEIPWIPPTLNDLLAAGKGKAGKWKLNKLKQDWTTKLSGFMSMSGLRPYEKNEPVWVEFVWYVPFSRDFDNLHTSNKFILDALQTAAIVGNDNLCNFQSPVEHWHERATSDEAYVIMTLSNTPRHNLQRHARYLSMVADALDRF